jgi:hypothetical protein
MHTFCPLPLSLCLSKPITHVCTLKLAEIELSAYSGVRQVVYPEEAILLGVVSIPCHEDVICLSWNPRGLQREWFRAKTNTKWRQGCQAFLLC